MRRVLILASIGTAICVTAPAALALGFGRTASPTLIGQPLDFRATIRLDPNEVLERRCVSAEVSSGENRVGEGQIQVSLEAGPKADERTIRVTTRRMIEEPIVTVTVTLGCNSQVTRRFVRFLDPPLVHLARADGAPRPSSEPQPVESAVAPPIGLVEPQRPVRDAEVASPPPVRPRRSARARHVSAHEQRRVARAPLSNRSSHRHLASAASAGRPAGSGGPRLRLVAAAPIARPATASAASAVAANLPPHSPPVPGAPDTAALLTALAQEREQIRMLESGLERLRADSRNTQRTLAAVQARLRDAEGQRYANPVVYGLGGLCLLLAAATGFGWRRRTGGSRWFDPTQLPPSTAEAALVSPTGAVDASDPETVDDTPWTYQPLRLVPEPVLGASAAAMAQPSTIGGLEVTTVIDHALLARMAVDQPAANAPLEPTTPREPHELSVEELIDLEQQADFFLVLGQEEATISLLSGHLQGSAGMSPLPHFKLLEIHRRRGEEAAYARVAEAFHQRFGAIAPAWDAAAGSGRLLEDHPEVIAQLQAAWTIPDAAIKLLDAWLFRRRPADPTFDFGVYRDLLFLYSVARDRADAGDDGSAVDLLLPIEDDPEIDLPLPMVPPSRFGELRAVRPSQFSTLDLDVSLPAPLEGESELRQALKRQR